MNKHPFLFLIAGIFSLMIAMSIGRFAYTPILPLMQNALYFSDAIAGYLASINYAGYLAGAILTWILPLKKNKTFYLRLAIIVSLSTTAIMGLLDSYTLMFIVRFASGVASAFIFVLASSIVLDRLAMANRSNWAGFFYSGVGFGIFFSTLFVPGFNKLFNWQGVWIGLAAVGMFFAIFVWLWLKEVPITPEQNIMQSYTHNTNPIKEILVDISPIKAPPISWLPWLIASYALEGFGYIVTGTFIVAIADKTPTFMIDSAYVWIIVGLSAIPSCIIWANLARKWGYIKLLAISMIIQSFGIVLPVLWLSQTSLIISAMLFGGTFMGITTLATTIGRQMNPDNSSKILGYMTAFYAFGQVIGPTVAGILSSSTESFNIALIIAASAVLIGALFLLNGIKYDKITAISHNN